MRKVTSLSAMQRLARQWQARGTRIGLVPTMGYLHDGHLSLVRQARRLVGRRGRVVVSIFVNPTQFGPKEDLRAYPRDLKRDLRLCRAAGVDAVFVPDGWAMYPAGTKGDGFSTWVLEERLSRGMEGQARPGHFRGVTTVVTKLFHLVLPEIAVFGAKDFQQAAVVRRMVRDLNFPVRLVMAPTRRDRDGLALSSRNRYLTGALRSQATVLSQALRRARRRIRRSRRPVAAGALRAELRKWIERQPDARVDYVEFFDPKTLEPVSRVGRGTQAALAVFLGQTRLIDNLRL